jgi:protein-tyrosine-phosphatase
MNQGQAPKLICFVCEWNEGRSVHLELSVRAKLREAGSHIRVMSAGFQEAGGVNPLRKEFLLGVGVPPDEIDDHVSTLFGQEHSGADLILVAELPMKDRLLGVYPELKGRVMTVRGFARGFTPETEHLSESETLMEDAGGKSREQKLLLYREHEVLAGTIAMQLIAMERP